MENNICNSYQLGTYVILNNGSRVMEKLVKKTLKKQNKGISAKYLQAKLQHIKVT